jgi:hypothetical protein
MDGATNKLIENRMEDGWSNKQAYRKQNLRMDEATNKHIGNKI